MSRVCKPQRRRESHRTRYGALLVFRDGVTKEEAVEALERIATVVEPPRQPFKMSDKIEEFDPEYGWPVFYVP